MVRIFVSHSIVDRELAEAIIDLLRSALALQASEIRCTSVDDHRLVGGADIDETLRAEAIGAPVFIALVSEASLRSTYVRFELGARWGSGKNLIPLLTPGSEPGILRGGPLAKIHALKCENAAQLHQLVKEVKEALPSKKVAPKVRPSVYQKKVERILDLGAGQHPGVKSPKLLHTSRERLSGEVFAVELLTRPVRIARDKSGNTKIIVDRRDVQEMLISNAGKAFKVQQCVTRKNQSKLLELDFAIQRFLAEGGGPSILINLPESVCLRWPSGGILSVVTDSDNKQWVPLFFRDIPPYGWNLALGTAERWFRGKKLDPTYKLDADLNNPLTLIWREFLEETLLVSGIPKPGGTLSYRPFHLTNGEIPFSEARAREFYRRHCALRKKEDLLTIRKTPGRKAEAKFQSTTCTLVVKSGSRPEPTSDVLVCFSLLDLGIEVVKVLEYKLDKGEWILDGEIKETHDAAKGSTERELVRMPTALLSLDYLKRVFGSGLDWHTYTLGPQPSIRVPEAPNPERDEVRYFDWDIRRRMQSVQGKWNAKSMNKRYLDWYEIFGEHFVEERQGLKNRWRLSSANPSRLFVPGAAKILNLYFSMTRREGKQ